MSRVIHRLGWLRQIRFCSPSAVATGLLSLTGLMIVGCSSDEPAPAANQAQANAAPAGGGAPAMPTMPGVGGAGGAPAGAAMMNPAAGGGTPGAAPTAPMGAGSFPGAGSAPGGVAGAPTAPAGAGTIPMPPAGDAVAGAAPTAPAGAGTIPMPPDGAVAGAAPAAPAGAGTAPMPPGGASNPAGANPRPPAGAGQPMPPGGVAGANPMPPLGAGQPMPPGAAAGAVPGAAPAGGFPGAGGAGSTPQSPQSAAGTAEFSAESIVIQALNGETSNLTEFISPKCKGVLGDIRNGKATEKQLDDLKKTFSGLKGISAKTDNGAKVLVLRNADNATVTFRVKKEGEDFKVIEMTVKASTAKKGR